MTASMALARVVDWHVPMFMPWKTAELLPPIATSATKRRKRVTFTTATTYSFDLDYGGSAVPSDHGPPIGLAKTHRSLECHDVYSHDAGSRPRRVRRHDHVERMLLLQHAGYSRKDVAGFCFEGIAVRKSRAESNEVVDEEPSRKRRRGYDDVVVLAPPVLPKRRNTSSSA